MTGGPDIFTPVHIVAVDQGLDERSGRGRTPHALVQDYLNRSDSLWGMVTNGAKLRLLRDSARLSKPTYLEFNIQAMIEGNAYSEFVALYRLLHATRLPHSGMEPHECLLESYYNQGIEEGGRVREKLRDGVRNALEVLGSALVQHPDSEALREALSGRLDDTTYYRQLLNFVYRMLFLMVTEERRLLFTSGDIRQQAVYDRYYSITHLRERAERYFAGDTHADLWTGLAQTFRLFRDDDAAQQLGLSPLNGELFGRGACRDIEGASCTNEAFLAAVLSLSTFDDNGVRRRVNYAHLDVEEFGSVYESLLDYRPVVDLGGASGAPPRFQLAAGTERKQTGSYYTPPELVRELVESALVPVMEERLAEAKTGKDKELALLDLRVCDPASGSGHFLLAAARRIARELARVRSDGDEPAPSEHRAALRDVVRSCLYAVDKNPLAVDLCKVALWIESHAVGLPLGFLDHHVKCGDSLIGVMDLSVLEDGIPNDAYKPVTGDDKSAAVGYSKRNQQERRGMRPLEQSRPEVSIREIAEEHAIFAGMEERNTAEVQAKFDLFRQLRGEGTRWLDLKIACDLWTSAFFLPLMPETPAVPQVPTTDTVRKWLESRAVVGTLTGKAAAAAAQGNFFHWPLEFPEVFESGGFDLVLGNPPWDQVQPEEVKFFGIWEPNIAALAGARRKAVIDKLPETDPQLGRLWESHKRSIEGLSKFGRASGRFKLTAVGKINKYSIFAETARTICGPAGRVGMIVPSGIATDDTTKVFFADLVDRRSLVSLYDFENRERVFPGIDSRIKFCLLTLSGGERPSSQAEFAFFLHRTEQLRDVARRFTLTPEDFALFNPNTRTCPVFRTRRDADIAGKMYRRAGVLWKEARGGGPELNRWGVGFSQMFNMTSASHLFRTREQLEEEGWRLEGNTFIRGDERYLPLYEAMLFHQYDHRFATFDDVDERHLAGGNARNMTTEEKADPGSVAIPRYWVPEEEVSKRLDNEGRRDIIQNPTESDRIRQNPTESDRIRQNPTESDRIRPIASRSVSSPGLPTPGRRSAPFYRDTGSVTRQHSSVSRLEPGLATNHDGDQPADYHIGLDSTNSPWAQGRRYLNRRWLISIRKTARGTDQRTSIASFVPRIGMSNRAPLIHMTRAEKAALLVAGLNSIVLDFATRTAIGGTDLSNFIVKQLPVLPPDAYLEEARPGQTWAELVVPRVLELTYTAWDLQSFAEDLGYDGPPFKWDEERRHRLKCELDAIFAHMYQLDRADLEWILDAPEPSASFPGLKRNELQQFGEYRTQRYVLQAYDQLAQSQLPDLIP